MSLVFEDLIFGLLLRDIVNGLLYPSIVPARPKFGVFLCFKPAFILSNRVAYFFIQSVFCTGRKILRSTILHLVEQNKQE